jgi:hypothetical protein
MRRCEREKNKYRMGEVEEVEEVRKIRNMK